MAPGFFQILIFLNDRIFSFAQGGPKSLGGFGILFPVSIALELVLPDGVGPGGRLFKAVLTFFCCFRVYVLTWWYGA